MNRQIKSACINIFILFLFINHVYAGEGLKISSPPSIWIQEKEGRLTGPIIELLENMFNEFGVKVTSVPLPWARAMTQIKSGKLDLIPVIFYTEERSRFMDFSIPYTDVPTSIFVPGGKTFTFESIDDLMGKKGVMMYGDSISSEFQSYKYKLDITEVAGYDQMIKMLASHRADYGVAAKYGFLIEAKKLGFETKIKALHNPVVFRSLHFAISKKSPYVKYLPEMNRRINELKTSGVLEQMLSDTVEKALER